MVLVRHGEAVCNVDGVVGRATGCTGLTPTGRGAGAAVWRSGWPATGELAGVAALYASVLPRAIETAAILAPALDRWRDGPPLSVVRRLRPVRAAPRRGRRAHLAGLCRAPSASPTGTPTPGMPVAPGGESWTGFVARASAAVRAIAEEHPGELVVVACHAGVVEASHAGLPAHRPAVARLQLRTDHASLTEWERWEGRFTLRRYNDVTAVPATAPR